MLYTMYNLYLFILVIYQIHNYIMVWDVGCTKYLKITPQTLGTGNEAFTMKDLVDLVSKLTLGLTKRTRGTSF